MTWQEPRPKVKDFVLWDGARWVSRWVRGVPKKCMRCGGEILPRTIAYRRLTNYRALWGQTICGKCANELGRSNS